MKKITIFFVLAVLCSNVFSQDIQQRSYKNTVSIGILHGGGGIVGVDYEKLLTKRVGLQAGVGILSFGAGLNVHFKPTIRSSFVSLQYWNQGFGDGHTQSVLGANYVFRGKKWLTFTIGLGATLDKGPAWPEDKTQTPVILTYAIGAYIPW